MTEDLRAQVRHYASSSPVEWHRLVELGPEGLPYVVEAFHEATGRAAKIDLIGVVREYRTAEALPFFEELLRQDNADLWKASLDGLVVLGGKPALDVLTAARGSASADKREWIDEAIEQIGDSERPG